MRRLSWHDLPRKLHKASIVIELRRMKFIIATIRQVLCDEFLKFYCYVKERLLMRIFRPYRLQLRFLRENAASTSRYIRRNSTCDRWSFNPNRMYLVETEKKLNPRGKRSLVFREAARRRVDMFALNEERNARACVPWEIALFIQRSSNASST